MVPIQPGSQDPLGRILRSIPRHPAPDVPLEAILERGHRRRRKALAYGLLGAAAAFLIAVSLLAGEPEPPVHLDLRFVDSDLAADVDAGPPEIAGP